MTIDQYRKQVSRQVQQAAEKAERALQIFRDESKSAKRRIGALAVGVPLREERDQRYVLGVAMDAAQPAEVRAAAIGYLTPLLRDQPRAVELLIARLGDGEEATEVRGAAARALKAAAFHTRGLTENRADYLEALRSAGRASDATLREGALGVLAREKDASTLRELEQGLRHPERALVDTEKALQLLSYDSKRDLRELLLDILRKPPSEAARLQALRNLAADPSSQSLFSRLAKNKKESREARLIALSALQSIDAGALEKLATNLLADENEDDELRAACLTAVATLSPGRSPELREAASSLAGKTRSRAARAAAKLYLNTPEE